MLLLIYCCVTINLLLCYYYSTVVLLLIYCCVTCHCAGEKLWLPFRKLFTSPRKWMTLSVFNMLWYVQSLHFFISSRRRLWAWGPSVVDCGGGMSVHKSVSKCVYKAPIYKCHKVVCLHAAPHVQMFASMAVDGCGCYTISLCQSAATYMIVKCFCAWLTHVSSAIAL